VAQALAARTSPERVAEYLLAAGPAAAPMVPWLAGHADELARPDSGAGRRVVQPRTRNHT